MLIIDEPTYFTQAEYESEIQLCVENLAKCPDVVSIYQVGNINTPGISDIDIIVVFKDGAQYLPDPRAPLNRYLFSHPLFGSSVSMFQECKRFVYFYNARLLYGKDLDFPSSDTRSESIGDQWRLEFLLKSYINLCVSSAHGYFKVRNFLLNTKALEFDLDLAGVEMAPLALEVERVIKWRNHWFENRPTDTELLECSERVKSSLKKILDTMCTERRLYLPPPDGVSLNKNIRFVPGASVSVSCKGLRIPYFHQRLHKFTSSLNYRLTRFEVSLAAQLAEQDSDRFLFFEHNERVAKYASEYFPYFMPMSSSLHLR